MQPIKKFWSFDSEKKITIIIKYIDAAIKTVNPEAMVGGLMRFDHELVLKLEQFQLIVKLESFGWTRRGFNVHCQIIAETRQPQKQFNKTALLRQFFCHNDEKVTRNKQPLPLQQPSTNLMTFCSILPSYPP